MSEKKPSLIEKFASRYKVDANKLLDSLKATAFKQRDGSVPTNEQLMALLVVADQYNLNPFTREIYAFPDAKNQSIIPVVGIDGWVRIVNEHPEFDGVEFNYSENMVTVPQCQKKGFEWVECVFYRKDRKHPTRVKEFLDEVYRPPFTCYDQHGQPYSKPGHWQSHLKRQHRHKAYIQGARIAFGFGGIYDPDEAQRIIESEDKAEETVTTPATIEGEVITQDKPEQLSDKVLMSQQDSDSRDDEKRDADETCDATEEVPEIELSEEVLAKLNTNAEKYVQRAKQHNCWDSVSAFITQRYTDKDQQQYILALFNKERKQYEVEPQTA